MAKRSTTPKKATQHRQSGSLRVKKIRSPTTEPTPKSGVALTPCNAPCDIFKGEEYNNRSLEPEPHRARDVMEEWECFQDSEKRREQDQGIDH